MSQILVGSLPPPQPATSSTLPLPSVRYRFGNFRLCLQQRQLWRDGAAVNLNPRALDLLIALVRQAGHVVEREELLQQVWGGTRVQDSNLTVNLCFLRRALGNEERMIATVPGRGYQFVAAVVAEGAPAWPSEENAPPVWLTVSPFQSVGEVSQYATLGAALGPALVAALAPMPGVRVRPGNGGGAPAEDWRLEGWYQMVKQTVRVTAQLVRGADGGVEWAGRRHFAAADNFQLQDRIAAWLRDAIGARVGSSRA